MDLPLTSIVFFKGFDSKNDLFINTKYKCLSVIADTLLHGN